MLFPIRTIAALVTILAASARAQTYSSCNPRYTSTCPPDTALGMAVKVDFTKGAVNSFTAQGNPTYDSSGVHFTVSGPGNAPQLNSVFYIMFGRVEITMKAAPGAGIVSSLVLQSDDLDEIDLEWLGADAQQVQSNYFGKGDVTTYNRGQFHDTPDNQGSWRTYVIDWTKDQIQWSVDGAVVRTLTPATADANQYPQTPMQVKFGAWSGGDPSNAPGTIAWARGPTDFSKGPFTMLVQSIAVTDYSTGKQYKYGDSSGSWQSIQAVDGTINGNAGNSAPPTVTAGSASGTAASGPAASVPAGGIAKGTATAVAPSGPAPSGWRFTPDGKIVPSGGSVARPSLGAVAATVALSGILAMLGR